MDYKEGKEERKGGGDASNQSKPSFLSTGHTDNRSPT